MSNRAEQGCRCEAEGYGCSDVLALTDNGDPQLLVHLDHCAYVPSFGCEVNLLSIQAAKAKGASFTFDGDTNVIHFPNGASITFGDDMTIPVTAMPREAYSTIMSRGKRGSTHIFTNKLTERQQLEMQLWSERLNGATADTLKHMNSIADGVPSILSRADRHNAISDARLHADGRKINAPGRTTPAASKPGERTAIDWWDAPCIGILGSTGLFCPIDIFSGHFYAYPMQSKSESDVAIDMYYRDAAHDGVVIPPGSVIFSDNEKIFAGRKFEHKVSE